MFLKNHWYVAAWSDDVGPSLLPRKLLGEPVVLYRLADGTPVALQDRCPHRNLPLSAGRLIGDRLQCGYHGLEFDAKGACVKAPGQNYIPDWCEVRSYPVTEKHGWMFVWMGDPAKSAESPVPVFHDILSSPDWGDARGQLLVGCGYRLILDNLLDLSHLAYVHSSTTGNADVADLADVEIASDGPLHVRQTRVMHGIEPAPALTYYGGYAGRIDRWQITNFHAPGYIDITNGSRSAVEPMQPAGGDGDMGEWGFRVFHAITPETASTTHQFWSVPYLRSMVPATDHALWVEQMTNVLREDHDVYVQQQRGIDDNPNGNGDVVPGGGLQGDKGLYRMRRVLEALQAQESAAVTG